MFGNPRTDDTFGPCDAGGSIYQDVYHVGGCGELHQFHSDRLSIRFCPTSATAGRAVANNSLSGSTESLHPVQLSTLDYLCYQNEGTIFVSRLAMDKSWRRIITNRITTYRAMRVHTRKQNRHNQYTHTSWSPSCRAHPRFQFLGHDLALRILLRPEMYSIFVLRGHCCTVPPTLVYCSLVFFLSSSLTLFESCLHDLSCSPALFFRLPALGRLPKILVAL